MRPIAKPILTSRGSVSTELSTFYMLQNVPAHQDRFSHRNAGIDPYVFTETSNMVWSVILSQIAHTKVSKHHIKTHHGPVESVCDGSIFWHLPVPCSKEKFMRSRKPSSGWTAYLPRQTASTPSPTTTTYFLYLKHCESCHIYLETSIERYVARLLDIFATSIPLWTSKESITSEHTSSDVSQFTTVYNGLCTLRCYPPQPRSTLRSVIWGCFSLPRHLTSFSHLETNSRTMSFCRIEAMLSGCRAHHPTSRFSCVSSPVPGGAVSSFGPPCNGLIVSSFSGLRWPPISGPFYDHAYTLYRSLEGDIFSVRSDWLFMELNWATSTSITIERLDLHQTTTSAS